MVFLRLLLYNRIGRKSWRALDHGARSNFGACIVRHGTLDTGENITGGFGGKKAGARWTKVGVGYSDNIRYFPWLTSIFAVSP